MAYVDFRDGSPKALSSEQLGRRRNRKISEDEWHSHQETIVRLYIDERHSAKDVCIIMARDYDFIAHEKAYKRKFEEWGLIKNIPKIEGLFMVRKRDRRRNDEGKTTIFQRRRHSAGPMQLVLDDKINRVAERNSTATPDNIEYNTPNMSHIEKKRPERVDKGQISAPGYGWLFPSFKAHIAGIDTVEHKSIFLPQ